MTDKSAEFSPLVQRAIQRLRDNIARREVNEDVEALRLVLTELADCRAELELLRRSIGAISSRSQGRGRSEEEKG